VARRFSGLRIFVYLCVAFLYLPLIVVVVYAFNSSSSLSWPIQGLSFRWFEQIFRDHTFRHAFWVSLQAALLTALISSVVATMAGLAFTRRRSRALAALQGVSILPAMVPPLFIAVALFTSMDKFKISPSLTTIVAGHLIIVIPFVLVVVSGRLRQFDVELEWAARDLGAGLAQTLRRITIPVILPASIGAALLAFAFSFDEVLVTNFTSGLTTTLPIYIYAKLHRSIDPSVNAVATLLMAIPWVALALATPFLRGRFTPRARRGEATQR
jgi:ABC-type spermidine/putrescine transport system permease subunit II